AARDAKNRRPVDQPIPLSIVAPLRDWLRDKAPGESVFPLHHDTGKAIRADLEACGIPYETEDGVADFHSLRGYYVSALVRSSRSIKEVQQLARHAKSETTLKHYAKVAAHDLHAALESLPDLAPRAPRPERLAATGTDGRSGPADGFNLAPACMEPRTDKGTFAPSLRHFGDASGRDVSLPDVMIGSNAPGSMEAQTLEKKPSDASSRVQTASGAERGGFEPPRPVSQPNGLANPEMIGVKFCSSKGLWIP